MLRHCLIPPATLMEGDYTAVTKTGFKLREGKPLPHCKMSTGGFEVVASRDHHVGSPNASLTSCSEKHRWNESGTNLFSVYVPGVGILQHGGQTAARELHYINGDENGHTCAALKRRCRSEPPTTEYTPPAIESLLEKKIPTRLCEQNSTRNAVSTQSFAGPSKDGKNGGSPTQTPSAAPQTSDGKNGGSQTQTPSAAPHTSDKQCCRTDFP